MKVLLFSLKVLGNVETGVVLQQGILFDSCESAIKQFRGMTVHFLEGTERFCL